MRSTKGQPSENSLRELALLFIKLGFIGFGGPASHIAMMEDEVVRRRRWMTRDEFRLHSRRKKRMKGDTDQLAAQLAPLEEQDQPAAQQQIGSHLNADGHRGRNYGAIIVDNEDLKVPTDIIEGRDEKWFLGMEPVVLVVLILMLSFIAFIAWQISLMPAR